MRLPFIRRPISGHITPAANGTYSLSGPGTLSAYSSIRGQFGHGHIQPVGGTNSGSYGFYLGNNAGAQGTYNLSGTSTLCPPITSTSATPAREPSTSRAEPIRYPISISASTPAAAGPTARARQAFRLEQYIGNSGAGTLDPVGRNEHHLGHPVSGLHLRQNDVQSRAGTARCQPPANTSG